MSFLRSALKLILKYPVAIFMTVGLAIFVVVSAIFGKSIEFGGILSRIWGKTPNNTVKIDPPPNRVDEHGKVIQPGESDSNGFVQPKDVIEIESPGIFSDHDKIVVKKPNNEEVTIKLPTGVQDKDVKQVIVINPDVYQVSNKDRPSVDVGALLKELNKK
jgi:hypothetical protein